MNTVRISAHAVERFIERALRQDPRTADWDAARRMMHSPALELAHRFGCSSVKAHGGRIVIKNGVAITFLSKEMRGELGFRSDCVPSVMMDGP